MITKVIQLPIVRIADLEQDLMEMGVLTGEDSLVNILYYDEYMNDCYKDLWLDELDWEQERQWVQEHFQSDRLHERLHEIDVRQAVEKILMALNLGDHFLLDVSW